MTVFLVNFSGNFFHGKSLFFVEMSYETTSKNDEDFRNKGLERNKEIIDYVKMGLFLIYKGEPTSKVLINRINAIKIKNNIRTSIRRCQRSKDVTYIWFCDHLKDDEYLMKVVENLKVNISPESINQLIHKSFKKSTRVTRKDWKLFDQQFKTPPSQSNSEGVQEIDNQSNSPPVNSSQNISNMEDQCSNLDPSNSESAIFPDDYDEILNIINSSQSPLF
jgi:hypothetical protein